MLNILWVEDEYSEQKQQTWFKNRNVTVKTSFDAAEQTINADLSQYDIVVLDINLENSEHSTIVKQYAKNFGISVREFLERSGMNLYFMLLEHGFPKDRIVFLTANANETTSQINDLRQAFNSGDDSEVGKLIETITAGFGEKEKAEAYSFIGKDECDENDFENLCGYLLSYFSDLNHGQQKNTYEELQKTAKSCRIGMPRAFNKNTNHLDMELTKFEKNKYLVLRRGVIEGCKYAESLIKSPIYFNNYMLSNELIQESDVENYFGILKSFFSIREPKNRAHIYKIFIRTLSHEWEAAKKIEIDRGKKDAVLAWVMRNTRHWITHNSNLFNEVDERLVAYLFLINIRVMFDSDDSIRDYEKILLRLFENESLDERDFDNKKIPDRVREAYIALRMLINNNHEIKDDYYFHKVANNIQESNSNIKNNRELFLRLLYQMFWMLTSNPLTKTKDCDNLHDIEFYPFRYHKSPYLLEVARHIYHQSFPQA